MSDYWKNLERDGGGRWLEDDVPNQKEGPMATRKPSKPLDEETDQEQAVDQRAIEETDTSDADGVGDPKASDSVVPPFTGIDGDAFPDRPEPILSEQTETITNDAGTEYEQPKFYALKDERAIRIAPFGWVGPEALTVPLEDVEDFKAFVAAL